MYDYHYCNIFNLANSCSFFFIVIIVYVCKLYMRVKYEKVYKYHISITIFKFFIILNFVVIVYIPFNTYN